MTVAEIGVRMQEILNRTAHQRSVLAAAVAAMTEAANSLKTVTNGSESPLISQGLDQVGGAIERLRSADRALAGYAQALMEYARLLGLNLASPEAARASALAPSQTPDRPSEEGDQGQGTDELPQWVVQAARRLPARKAKEPTSGVAFIGDEQIPMKSGREPEAAADLKPAYRLIATTTDHIEAKLAARMRRDGVREASMITNNPPCDYEPYGCEKILPRLLPAGARLTVFVRDDDGQVRQWRTYSGNGKAIA